MDILTIPFVETLGLSRTRDNNLQLAMEQRLENHLGTLHASAQFALAETASGDYLLKSFPELEDKAIPVLRDSEIKFKRPADSTVRANVTLEESAKKALLEQLEKRGRGMIELSVTLIDSAEKITSISRFNWFVQQLNKD